MSNVLSEFGDLMIHEVTYRPVTGRNNDGQPTFGTAVTYRAYVDYASMRTANQFSGQDWIGAGTIYLGGLIQTIDHDDEWTLPDGTKPKVIRHIPRHDERGAHHSELIFGGTQFGGNR